MERINELLYKAANWGADCIYGVVDGDKYNTLDRNKMADIIKIFLMNMSNIIIIYGFAMVFGNFLKTLTIHLSYTITKKFSFGSHVKNETVYAMISIGLFVLLPFVTPYIAIDNNATILVFSVIVYLHWLYAPANTQKYPVIEPRKRGVLKCISMLCVTGLAVLALLMPDEEIKTLYALGAICQTVNILPIPHRI